MSILSRRGSAIGGVAIAGVFRNEAERHVSIKRGREEFRGDELRHYGANRRSPHPGID